ncbi:cytochrome P450 family protein [Nocardia brasiliensis]|uniref:cytochrome P450 family protein n=1 Tax=Nocardia brasiliensis TaxID=37326 RepID=UPI0024540CE7|nr:cytochrome P450 [Nocardia brasiliensis]
MPRNFFQDPYDFYQVLNEKGSFHPVVLGNGMRTWLVTGFGLAAELLRNPALCKDARTTAGIAARSGAGRSGATTVSGGITAHMLNSDPPAHTRLRRIVSSAFTPVRVAALRPRVVAIADALLDDMARVEGGTLDLIEEYAAPIPITVICELLGVAAADRKMFRKWTNSVIDVLVGDADAVGRDSRSLEQYLHALVDERRRSPRDDLISALIAAGSADERLSDTELVSTVFLILVAGHETTVNLIANAALTVADGTVPACRGLESPERLVEETLRHNGPVNVATLRYAACDIPAGSHTISRGEVVLIALAAADRDEKRFTCPDVFDLDRETRGHLAFGGGIHQCLGAGLARMEGSVAIRQLLTRFPGIRLAEPMGRWRASMLIRGLDRLIVTVE